MFSSTATVFTIRARLRYVNWKFNINMLDINTRDTQINEIILVNF